MGEIPAFGCTMLLILFRIIPRDECASVVETVLDVEQRPARIGGWLDRARDGCGSIRKERQWDVAIGVPLAQRELRRMHPVGLAGASRRRFFGEAVAVNSVAPLVAAFSREHSNLQA